MASMHRESDVNPPHPRSQEADAVETTRRRVTAVLVDLDGTITDSAPIILPSVSRTLRELGLAVPDHEGLMRYVGPPLTEGFRLNAGLVGADNARAVELYRRHYRTRMLQSPVYDGVPEVIRGLHAQGVPLALATSKHEGLAVQILEHLDLADAFTAFSGADPLDRHGTKAEVIRHALDRLARAGAAIDRVVHVGDRAHDVDGAHEAGLECIGVLWGYGDRAELAQAEWCVAGPDQLASLLGRLTGSESTRQTGEPAHEH